MNINMIMAIVQLIVLIVSVVAYWYVINKGKKAFEEAHKDMEEMRRKHTHNALQFDREIVKYKRLNVDLEYQIAKYKKITPEKIGEAMDAYQEVHTLMKQTLHDEAYEYVLANDPQEAELVFTWVLKHNYTIINIETKGIVPHLRVMDGVDYIYGGTIKKIFNEKLVKK